MKFSPLPTTKKQKIIIILLLIFIFVVGGFAAYAQVKGLERQVRGACMFAGILFVIGAIYFLFKAVGRISVLDIVSFVIGSSIFAYQIFSIALKQTLYENWGSYITWKIGAYIGLAFMVWPAVRLTIALSENPEKKTKEIKKFKRSLLSSRFELILYVLIILVVSLIVFLSF